jgi:hypothetical protein
LSVQDIDEFIAKKTTILQVIICDDLHRGSMLNSGNNDREQNWLLLRPRVKRAESDWRATVTLGCPRWCECNNCSDREMENISYTFRSIVEPVRETKFRQADHFHLAIATGLNIKEKTVECQSTIRDDIIFKRSYDKLVIGVGALSNTFGVPGVEEHACFLKVFEN